ncbi:MAG: nucleoside-diphosphate kinase [Chlamydiales bacterium]
MEERTLSIIKPDGVSKNLIGKILDRFEKAKLKIVGVKMLRMSKALGEQFYAIHKNRPFYQELVTFISSGPILVSVLQGENAIMKNRDIMGATDPKKALIGTIRADFADSIEKNIVHGSDGIETAATEIAFFFKPEEIYPF